LIFKHQRIESFFLFSWLATKDEAFKVAAAKTAQNLVKGVKVNKSFGLHQIKEAIDFYGKN